VVGVMSLLGGWSVAYCTNDWCREQTSHLCCCVCRRCESLTIINNILTSRQSLVGRKERSMQ
jgi:hypothetical protein